MIDFTLKSYAEYVAMIKHHFEHILTFEEYFSWNKGLDKFCIIRHDVDRKPENALRMAVLEHRFGVRSTYYFRTKKHVFNKHIIKKISRMGHEIGYHYESLSDKNGDLNSALFDFESNLNKLRKIVKVSTICMHGRPFSPYDDRDLWKNSENHGHLLDRYGIMSEVYLDIDYSNMAYITDTGRNWSNDRNNVRDKVNSEIDLNITCSTDLIKFLKRPRKDRLIFLVHPERWHDDFMGYSTQFMKDQLINIAKRFV